MTLVVTDTTPLIALDRVGHLDLLPAPFEVHAPPTVVEEFGRRPPWLVDRPAPDALRVAALAATLDPGEAGAVALEAIALAETYPNVRLPLDERTGRQVALCLGLRVTGTPGVLLAAKAAGLIPLVRPVLDTPLTEHGFYLSDASRAEVLRDAGE